jgi:hypothetical protein
MADRSFTRELVKTYGVDRDLPCPRCRYNLRGLAGDRCPECGANVSSYIKKAALRRGDYRIVHLDDVRERILAYAGPAATVLLAGGFWAAVRVSDPPVWIGRFVSGTMILMVLAAANVWWQLVRRLWRRRPIATRLVLTILCWAPALAAVAAAVALLS